MPLPEIVLLTELPADNLRSWMEQMAITYDCAYLLAHAEDGIIWGRFDDGKLTTSHDTFAGPHCRADIRPSTLWEARLFGANTEVLLWQTNGAWRARIIRDATLASDDYIVEQQMLWGDHAEVRAKGFTLLADGSEGLCHAVPIEVPDNSFIDQTDTERKRRLRPVRLKVHHYIDYDSDGNARIALSRLVTIK